MFSPQQVRRFFITMILPTMVLVAIACDFGTTDNWARAGTSTSFLTNQPEIQIATMNRVEAVSKNIEGKTQSALGNLSGDPKDQIMGKAKQVESQARHAAENVKDQVKLKGRTKAVSKNIEGRVQEARGNTSGNPRDQVAGKAKQAESQARNVVEDIKDTVQEIFN